MKFLVAVSLLAVAIVTDAGVSMNNPFYCYSADPIRPQEQMHSVQTSYEAIRRTQIDPAVSTCTPARFWTVSRHGGRLPSASLLTQMLAFASSSVQADIIRNYEAGRTTLCRQDFELIRDWVQDDNITEEVENVNTAAGWSAMENMGRRYQQFYPTILPSTYTRARFFFRHTDRQRSQGSIRAFADGLFGSNRWSDVTFEDVPARDTLLRPTDFCPMFRDETANRPERDAFESGPEYEEMMAQVNRRLGFQGSNQLSISQVFTMWEWCRFEKGSSVGDVSAWCAPFTVANTAVLEYYEDLNYYYLTGYGVRNQRLIENLNCGLMQDMLTFMQSTNANDQSARVFGTHSVVIQAFLVTLGAFRDTVHQTQHNFAQQSFRTWRTSLITSKAANLAVVRYE